MAVHYDVSANKASTNANLAVGTMGDTTGTLYLASHTNGKYGFTSSFHAMRIYNRALTADEIKWNTTLDKVRFFNASSDTAVTVGNLPTTYGLVGVPTLGATTPIAENSAYAISLAGLSEHPDDGVLSREYATNCRARFYGWSYTNGIGNAARTTHASGVTTNGTVSVTNLIANLTWDVRNELKLSISACTGGKVRLAGGAAVASDSCWVEDTTGSVVIEAVPDTGYEFVSWTGNLEGVSSVTSAVTTCTSMKAAAAISAFFRETSHTPVTLNWKSGVKSGNFNDPACWAEGVVPGAGDTLYITNCENGAVTITVDTPTARLKKLVISNLYKSGGNYPYTTTLSQKNWMSCIAADEIVIGTNGVVSTMGGFSQAAMSNRVWLVGNTLTITPGGLIDARNCGWTVGPGSPGHHTQGAVYGGAWKGTTYNAGPMPYGSAEWPTDPGSGATGLSGGGAIRLDFAGLVRVDGTVIADGGPKNYGSCASGGGILIVCDRITGSGEVLARSRDKISNDGSGHGGGGGRIAVHYTPSSQAAVTDCVVRFDASSTIAYDPMPKVGYGVWLNYQPTWGEDNILLIPPGTLWMPDATLLRAASYRASGWKFGGEWVSPEPIGDLVFDDPILFDQCMLALPASCSSFTVRSGMTLTGTGPYGRRDMGLFLSNTVVTVTGNLNASGARLEIYGGSLMVNGNVNLTDNGYTKKGFACRFNGGEVAVMAGATNGTDLAYGATVRVAGSVNVSTNSTFYLGCHPTDGAIVYMSVKRMTVDRGGKVSSELGGWKAGRGPGMSDSMYRGASYGGKGSPINSTAGTYGVYETPLDPGSGSSTYPGGGVVRLDVDRVLTLNGEISANSSPYVGSTYYSGGSGGSVYVRALHLVGSGFVSAAGGLSDTSTYSYAAGGGGRVAIWTHDAENWTGTVTAEGGYKQSSAASAPLTTKQAEDGTVYFGTLPGIPTMIIVK